MRAVPLLALAALLLSAPARGQGYGLDLSFDDQPKPQPKPKAKPKPPPPPPAPAPAPVPEGGLDLSAPLGPDFRPTIAVLAIGVPDEVDPAGRAHAERLSTALVSATRKTSWYAKIVSPAEAEAALGDGAAAALTCSVDTCLAELGGALGVDRVLTAQMEFPYDGPTLKLQGFDIGTATVEEVVVEAAGAPQGFDRKVAAAFKALLQKLSTPLGTIKVTTNVPEAAIVVSGRPLGNGQAEGNVAAGKVVVRVSAPEYQPYDSVVTVQAKETSFVHATLVKKVSAQESLLKVEAAPPPPKAPSKPFYTKPGLYVAVAGLAVAAVGLGFGLAAKSIEGRAKDTNGDGILDMTRSEKDTAVSDARMANILAGAGAAIFTGGALWFALEPAPAVPGKGGREPGAPEPVGFLFTTGGEF